MRTLLNGIEGVFSAEPSKMHTLLSYLHEHYGSIDRYVAGIGVGPDVVARLRATLLEPAAAS